ncbi:Thaumatin-like protein [Drosera capensis]
MPLHQPLPHTIYPAALLAGATSPPPPTTGFSLPSPPTTPSPSPSPPPSPAASGPAPTAPLSIPPPSPASPAAAAPAPSPATLAEFTLNGSQSLGFYDLSLVDGFNLPILVAPMGRGCGGDVVRRGAWLMSIGGEFDTPETCPANEYSRVFKEAGPRAYSSAYDDKTSTLTCKGADYLIMFCPPPYSGWSEVNVLGDQFHLYKMGDQHLRFIPILQDFKRNLAWSMKDGWRATSAE